MPNIRDKLKVFIEYSEALKIRKLLHEEAKNNYIPKYKDEYLLFMNNNECNFKINHPQEVNFPYYFTLFTIKSQHVMGDCIEECFDKAIEKTKNYNSMEIGKDLHEGIKKFLKEKN